MNEDSVLRQRKDGTFYVWLKKKLVKSLGLKDGQVISHRVKGKKYVLEAKK